MMNMLARAHRHDITCYMSKLSVQCQYYNLSHSKIELQVCYMCPVITSSHWQNSVEVKSMNAATENVLLYSLSGKSSFFSLT